MKARSLFTEWQKRSKAQRQNVKLLQQKRDEFAAANVAVKNRMRNAILTLERKVESEEEALKRMELDIRRLEQEVLYK